MTDVFDALGNTHVIIALTPDECRAVTAYLGHGLADSWECYDEAQVDNAVRAQREVECSLRDQRTPRPSIVASTPARCETCDKPIGDVTRSNDHDGCAR